MVAIPCLARGLEPPLPEKIEFNRDVRPILSENCFKCHGFDKKKREADRRLDTREGALAENDGIKAIVPGKLAESEVHLRIHSSDKDEAMPPVKSGKKLSERQKAILDKWIEQGAEYQAHWAYLAPACQPVPPIESGAFPVRNPIDAFIQARLAEMGLQPSPETDRITLARRVFLDVTGLPPSTAEISAFLADESANAYERLVDRLLMSPAFGERMAVSWLDVVRYADTIGFHSDNPRNVWPYRDYVIAAFNADKPFSQFTIEQLAGDLLPGSTTEQKVASTFNRLNLTTEEGGAQAKDYEARTVADRVRAVGTAWLGQTTGCAQCHDHKYDPITTRDFYQLGAFFADIKEAAIGHREDGMLLPTTEQQAKLDEFTTRIAALQKQLDTTTPELAMAQTKWEEEFAVQKQGAKEPPAEIVSVLKVSPGERTPAQTAQAAKYFRSITPALDDVRKGLTTAQQSRANFEKEIPHCLVTESTAPTRTVRILPRGDWQNETGEIVEPGVLHFLPQPPNIDGRRLTRLDLAQWLVSRENPLTARVFVNRLWKLFFGTGLCKVLDDLGAQGEPPHNPALLDWLACEFMDNGWKVKDIVREIVNSHAYRQKSEASADLLLRDPDNREFARQSRFRMDAEFVRDNALTISGLLVRKIGGPSVNPYQPAGYWENLNFPVREWKNDTGENQWRRGLYTHWQRSYLHPSLLAFDAPSREECVAERVRSNIPQQALTLLNDPTYVEAARVFATRIIKEGGVEPGQRIAWAFREALGRAARPDELQTLGALANKHLNVFANAGEASAQLLAVGLTPIAKETNSTELAAWTSVARVILNLHETITRS